MADDSIPSPKNILRGHKAAVHASAFLRSNERLATGDAEGYVVIWDLTIMRPRAVWRAHENAILGIRGWGSDKIITHGRDHKLVVWKLGLADEDGLSTALPLEDVAVPRVQPWIVHLLEVNTMNFCSFAACGDEQSVHQASLNGSEILIAVPNTLASEAIDIYQLPSQSRIHTIKPGDGQGMAMSLALLRSGQMISLIAAFENGHASVHRLQDDGQWLMTYRSQAHAQPVLSMMVAPDSEYFLTSGADAIVAKHPIPDSLQTLTPAEVPDSNQRVVEITDEDESQIPSLLSSGLGGSGAGSSKNAVKQPWSHPLKVVNTKHAGQQGLEIRSDGKIFATAGWDNKARVYSCKTLKELAVLEWHKVGCYAAAFPDLTTSEGTGSDPSSTADRDPSHQSKAVATTTQSRSLVKSRRIRQATATHWLAIGAKDGKISLWDIY